jgi:serine/threonine protein kinase
MVVRSPVAAGTRIAGFRIESLIGEGAMGAVYLATDSSTGERVALKLLAPELALDERFRQRFLQESRVVAGLDHPHIVAALGSGETDDMLYLAMRYIDGSDLRAVLRREGTIEPARAIAILVQVADALDTAHRAGVVHRDVKPGNILLTEADEGAHAYVCDFGLARHISSVSSLTGQRGFVGTIDYVPPEQIEGGPLDGRADVYSLGCVLYECLAGERPFERETELSVVFAHLNEPPPRLSERRSDLPEAFDTVFATALAKSPGERYPTCGALVAASRAALTGEGGAVRTPRSRRRLLAASSALAVACVALIALVVERRHDTSPPANVAQATISQDSIGGIRLGVTEKVFKRVHPSGWREDVFTLPDFRVLIFQAQKRSVYFDDRTHRSIIVTTWNPHDRLADGGGPCSDLSTLEGAYRAELKPSRWNTQKGHVYAYTLGKNLMVAMGGRPPHPSNTVAAIALYDGDGPKNDGTRVDAPGGTRPFAGFVALSEIPCA